MGSYIVVGLAVGQLGSCKKRSGVMIRFSTSMVTVTERNYFQVLLLARGVFDLFVLYLRTEAGGKVNLVFKVVVG